SYLGQVDVSYGNLNGLGNGWSLAGMERVRSVSGGLILEQGAGRSLWFAANVLPPNTYATPPGDFSTLGANNDGTFTHQYKDRTIVSFNAAGLETSVRDRNGNTYNYGYDANNRLTSITDPYNQITTLAYNGQGYLNSITD